MGAPASGLLLRLRVSGPITIRSSVAYVVLRCPASGTSMGKDVMQAVEKIAMNQGGELVVAVVAFHGLV